MIILQLSICGLLGLITICVMCIQINRQNNERKLLEKEMELHILQIYAENIENRIRYLEAKKHLHIWR